MRKRGPDGPVREVQTEEAAGCDVPVHSARPDDSTILRFFLSPQVLNDCVQRTPVAGKLGLHGSEL